MIPTVAAMLKCSSNATIVMSDGATQLFSVLAYASKLGINEEKTSIRTTSYSINDHNTIFKDVVHIIPVFPIIFIDSATDN